MAGFEIIEKARLILGLPRQATRAEVRAVYRRLSLRYHPDKCSEAKQKQCAKKFREITQARKVLDKYLDAYRYVFTEEDFKKHLGPESKGIFSRFYFDWF